MLKIKVHDGSGRIVGHPLLSVQDRRQGQPREKALRGTHRAGCRWHHIWLRNVNPVDDYDQLSYFYREFDKLLLSMVSVRP